MLKSLCGLWQKPLPLLLMPYVSTQQRVADRAPNTAANVKLTVEPT